MKKEICVLMQIYLMVSLSFYISHTFAMQDYHSPYSLTEKKSIFLDIYEKIIRTLIGDKNLVSAVSVYTCIEGKDGSKCQEYSISTNADITNCNNFCSSECIPTNNLNIAECKLGTCFDPVEGTCQENSPKGACESYGGEWKDDPLGNIAECNPGCCVLGEETMFSSQRECIRQSDMKGLKTDFRSEIKNELSCLALSKIKEEGACVLLHDDGKTCKFVTKEKCNSFRGDFFPNTLCSKEELGTDCIAQQTTGCYEGRDEVFWYDSCGNRENVFSLPKSDSYNNGTILPYDKICKLSLDSNGVINQESCGNCNYLLGTRCGAETETEKASFGDFVCRDIRCRDSNGKLRENGESWCEYQSQTGLDLFKNRARDVPGAGHFRATCINGEIEIDACSDYRNQICIESQIPKASGGTFSSAACRENTWQLCLQYNSEIDSSAQEIQAEQDRQKEAMNEFRNEMVNKYGAENYDACTGDVAIDVDKYQETCEKIERDYETWYDSQVSASQSTSDDIYDSQTDSINALCSRNPDCFVKNVNIAEQFKFNLCAPKYPPGFEFNSLNPSSAGQSVCGMATQECTWVEVKKLSGWKCKVNCGCKEQKFVEQMNDLCTSLGDCGATVNYIGDSGFRGYSVNGDTVKSLSASYLTAIAQYSKPIKGFFINSRDSPFFGLPGSVGQTGIPTGLGGIGEGIDDNGDIVGTMGMIGGATGMLLYGAVHLGIVIPGLITAGTAGSAGFLGLGAIAHEAGFLGLAKALGFQVATPPAFSALGGALAGAAIGLAVVSMLIQWTGIGAGLDPWMTYTLMGAGAVSLAVVGYHVATAYAAAAATEAGATVSGAFSSAISGSAWAAAMVWVFVAVVVIIVVLKILGIGKTKEHKVKFTCSPWQPPLGGAKCSQCGKDGLPCTRYGCKALGQTCELVNEGTGEELCVNINPKDVTNPKIKPKDLSGDGSEGYGYGDVTERGFRIVSNNPGGCFKEYDLIDASITLDEPGICNYDNELKEKFEDMALPFGSPLFTFEKTEKISVPSLIRLGESDVGPDRRADYNLYIRCMDKTGNTNIDEYSINFCVEPGEDVSSPVVTSHEPNVEYISKQTEKMDLTIYTNEPAECKMSKIDLDYDGMETTMLCENGIDSRTLKGWKCLSNLNTPENKTQVYIKCKDQPWLSERDESKRNKNDNPYKIVYSKTEKPLEIESIKPNNETLTFGKEPVSFKLELTTKGGIDGTASCFYNWGGREILFYESGSRYHKQTFESFTRGDRVISVKCVDRLGNEANAEAKFKIDIDEGAPKITRAYELNSDLYIITDEESSCGFVNVFDPKQNQACAFSLSNQNTTRMNGNSLIHTTKFERDKTYYIKCEDKWGNFQGNCNIIVSGGVV